MNERKHDIEVTAAPLGEVRLTTDLYPEEVKHGALVRGFSGAEARRLAAKLIAAAETVEAEGWVD